MFMFASLSSREQQFRVSPLAHSLVAALQGFDLQL
jgi:hypothetical protein